MKYNQRLDPDTRTPKREWELPLFKSRWAVFAMLVTAAFSVTSSSSAQTQKRVPKSAVTGRNVKALDFMDTFGVNVHFHENGYSNTAAIANALKRLGFSRVRATCESAGDIAAWKALAAPMAVDFPSGLKADVLITGYLNAPDVTFSTQQVLVPQIAGMIESIEGPNEINNHDVGNGTHGPNDMSDQTDNWPANSTSWAGTIFNWKQSTPVLSKAMLFAPSIASGDPSDYARLPNISPYVTAGNIHFYAGNGRQPSNFGGGNFAAIFDWYKAAATPSRPVVLTEWGQTTAGKPGQAGCDPKTQAKYILNQMFDATAKGVFRAYVYQLMDDTANGDPTGDGGAEAHFGLFDYQWHPKPAALALANIRSLLADTTTKFTAKVPAYSVSDLRSAGAAGSSLSISKSDGSTILVVWNEAPIWDAATNTALTPTSDRVTVNFGSDYSYQVYDPLVGPRPIAMGHGSHTSINVIGSPILLRLIPRHKK